MVIDEIYIFHVCLCAAGLKEAFEMNQNISVLCSINVSVFLCVCEACFCEALYAVGWRR